MNEEGDIRVFNPSKEISKEIILEILVRHRDVMKQARTGEVSNMPDKQFTDNERKFNQVKALNLIISAQREMITLSRPVIYFRSLQKWKKVHISNVNHEKEILILKPFEDFESDYKKLREWLDLLRACEQDILLAERTKSLKDDYIIEKQDALDGSVKQQLTGNFYEMLDELESSYEQIYLLMLTNKIVSAGIEEDEELTYQQKEKEAIQRVLDA